MSSTARSLRILMLFSPQRAALSATEIAAGVETTLSTVYRDLEKLRAMGLVENYGGEKFILGGGVSVLDRVARLSDPLLAAVQPELARIARDTGFTATLTRLFGTRLLGLSHARGVSDISIGYERGQLVPLFRGCSGKVILSIMPWRKLKALHLQCAPEIAGAGLGRSWKEFLGTARSYGQKPVLWTSGEVMPSNTALAVSIEDPRTGVIGSLTVIFLTSALSRVDRGKIEAELLQARDRAYKSLTDMDRASRLGPADPGWSD